LNRILHILLLTCLLSATAAAQVVDPRNVVIRNVNIVQGGEEEAGQGVSLLIRDNKLEIITRDDVATPEGVIALDATDGFLVGTLKLGESPSFIILDTDPRGNFEVFLDTQAHVVFAVHEGELRANSLVYDAGALEEPEEEPEPARWLAYTPPPLAVPTSYGDPSKFNQWQTKNTTGIFTGAVVLDRMHWLSQDGASEQQVGVLDDFSGGEIRGLRIGAIGTLNYFEKPLIYTVFGATNAFDKGFEREELDSFTLFDVRLDIPIGDGMTLSVGKQKEPISMERVMSLVQLPMQERSAVSDALLPSRNVGAVLSGTAFGQDVTWAGGVFNDWLDTDSSISDSATQVIGRGTWLTYASDDESDLVHLGAGIRYSDGQEGARGATEPEFNKSPPFVDVGPLQIDADSIFTYNLEGSWRRGPYWLAAEYTNTRVDSPTFGNLSFDGYNVVGSWILTGEMREYRRRGGIFGPVPIAQSVYQGGWGAWEASARFSNVNLTDGAVDGGDMDILSMGLNWWLSPVFNINVNYRYIWNERGGLNGRSSGALARVMLVLE